MAYLMDDNAMRICIRPRPWHPEKELPFISQPVSTPFFVGGGNFATTQRKPAAGGALREIVAVIDNRQIDFDKPEEGAEARRMGGGGGRRYKNRRYVFDHVFRMDANQEEVYENTAKPLLEGVLNGYNATVFAYGATGCGKTHTISGNLTDPGIIVRTMRDLFDRIEETKDKYITHLELSMVELYNEQIRDLLSDNFPVTPTGGLKLLENEKERVTIADVTIKEPNSVEEVLDLVMLGNERRSTSSTNANNQSSRSHAVLQVNVTRSNRVADVDMDRETVLQDTSSATLSIVDLAGSERASATRNMGARMKEGAKINQSLLALSSCISALCAAQRNRSRPHVPYRNSKLTRLLKFSLGGNCRTVMIVCVSPSSRDMEDTSNTLTWANKAKDVKTRVTRNVGGHEVSTRQYLEKIAEQAERIKLLEAQLEKQDQNNLSASVSKLESGRKRISELLFPVITKVDLALADIREGAELRARYDGADMGASSVTSRRSALDAACSTERLFCDQIISWYGTAYRTNRSVETKINRETTLSASINDTLVALETRTFPDLDPVNISNLKLQIELQRARYEAAVAEGREKGYRASLACAHESLADCAVAFVSLKSGFGECRQGFDDLTAHGSAPVGQLERLMDTFEARVDETKDQISNTFKTMTTTGAVPNNPLRPPTQFHAPSPVAPPPPQAPAPHSSPGTNSPAYKRVLAAAEKKGSGYVVGGGSPRKPVKKTARFAEDKDGLEDIRHFAPSQCLAGIATRDYEDHSGEWEEMKDEVKPLAPPPLRSALRSTSLTAPPPFKVHSAPPPPPAAAPAISAPPAASSSSTTDSVPEWKKHRILMGKGSTVGISSSNAGNMSTMGDTSLSAPEQTASPSGKRTPTGLGLGRPRASPALAELHQIPPSHGPGRASLASSTLLQPTAASAARAAAQNGGGSDKPASPLSQSTYENSHGHSRRLSVSRRERSKLHKSGVPYKRKVSLNGSPTGAGAGAGSPGNSSISPRGGVDSRRAPLSASTTRALSKPPVRLRSSVFGPSSGGAGGGGDTSMSSAAGDTSAVGLGRSLRHTMSIGSFGAAGVGAGGATPGLRPRSSMQQLGMQASRPAWK